MNAQRQMNSIIVSKGKLKKEEKKEKEKVIDRPTQIFISLFGQTNFFGSFALSLDFTGRMNFGQFPGV